MEAAQIAEKKPKAADKADRLTVYDCKVNIATITRNVVPKRAVTAPEIALLISQFGKGEDGVHDIEEGVAPSIRRPAGANPEGGRIREKVPVVYLLKNEAQRLREKYGPKLVKHVFGTAIASSLPKTLEDLNEMNIDPFIKKDDEKEAA